ncbi:hypothetical protein E2320_018100, partial [Naja naja]
TEFAERLPEGKEANLHQKKSQHPWGSYQYVSSCKEYLRPFKKTLQRLNLPKDYPKEKKLICTKKSQHPWGSYQYVSSKVYCRLEYADMASQPGNKKLAKLHDRCSTTQGKEVMEQHCATCDVSDALSVTTNEETASSSSSNLY